MKLNPSKKLGTVTVVPNRTYVSYFKGELIWAEVYPTESEARKHRRDMESRDRRNDWSGWSHKVI